MELQTPDLDELPIDVGSVLDDHMTQVLKGFRNQLQSAEEVAAHHQREADEHQRRARRIRRDIAAIEAARAKLGSITL